MVGQASQGGLTTFYTMQSTHLGRAKSYKGDTRQRPPNNVYLHVSYSCLKAATISGSVLAPRTTQADVGGLSDNGRTITKIHGSLPGDVHSSKDIVYIAPRLSNKRSSVESCVAASSPFPLGGQAMLKPRVSVLLCTNACMPPPYGYSYTDPCQPGGSINENPKSVTGVLVAEVHSSNGSTLGGVYDCGSTCGKEDSAKQSVVVADWSQPPSAIGPTLMDPTSRSYTFHHTYTPSATIVPTKDALITMSTLFDIGRDVTYSILLTYGSRADFNFTMALSISS